MSGGRSLLVVCALASACTNTVDPTPSTEVPTAQLSFSITARSDGHVTQVIVAYHGDLVAPDRLYARAVGGDESSLVPLGAGEWVTQLVVVDTPVVLGLARAGGVRIETTLTLPPGFTVKTPAATSQRAPIVLEWDAPAAPATYAIALDVEGECIQPIHRSLSTDTGTFTLQPADFFPVGAPHACPLTVEVRRRAPSTASWTSAPAPAASVILEQTRSITFASTL